MTVWYLFPGSSCHPGCVPVPAGSGQILYCSQTLTQLLACLPPGAIGNAEWAGVRLRDVLEYAGFDERTANEVTHAGQMYRLN